MNSLVKTLFLSLLRVSFWWQLYGGRMYISILLIILGVTTLSDILALIMLHLFVCIWIIQIFRWTETSSHRDSIWCFRNLHWCIWAGTVYSTTPKTTFLPSSLQWDLSSKFTVSLLSSINHLHFFSALTTQWISFRSKTITPALSQIRLLSAFVPVKVCQVFDASRSPLPSTPPHTPTHTHAHTQQPPPPLRLMEMLAGYRCWPVVAVWDVLPVLQSAGKLWQAYLPWRSLTWKTGGGKKWGWRISQLPTQKRKTSISRICFIRFS